MIKGELMGVSYKHNIIRGHLNLGRVYEKNNIFVRLPCVFIAELFV